MEKIKSKNPEKYNLALAKALKEVPEFKAPEWVFFVKSSVHRERPISDPDFWYKRSASILRQISIKGVVGTQRLKTRYGGKKDRGGKPSEFRKASGKIIRTILQQADSAGLTEKVTSPKPGRALTSKGKEFLESIKLESSSEQ
jgi:small subunit ribosomal protein S19e